MHYFLFRSASAPSVKLNLFFASQSKSVTTLPHLLNIECFRNRLPGFPSSIFEVRMKYLSAHTWFSPLTPKSCKLRTKTLLKLFLKNLLASELSLSENKGSNFLKTSLKVVPKHTTYKWGQNIFGDFLLAYTFVIAFPRVRSCVSSTFRRYTPILNWSE